MARGEALALAALMATVAFAGCVDGGSFTAGASASEAPAFAARAEPLWWNPQTFPHPAFGWATLSNPPEADAGAPSWWAPIPARALPEPVAGIKLHASARNEFTSGAGMALFGSLAVVPGFSGPTHIVDISDPADPQVLSRIESPRTRGADIIAYPDGRLVAVFATGVGILPVYDITDPRAPELLSTLEPTTGTHKVSAVPGTPIVYNANANGGSTLALGDASRAGGLTEIFDLTDPENPVHVQDFANGYGCHHLYFWIHAAQDKHRALCAGMEVTQIWDIADPRAPEVLVTIPVHHGLQGVPPVSATPYMFSHFAILNDDATVLVVGDETGGGGLPGCDAHAQAAGLSASGPLGNLWFYDVTDEANPRLLGTFGASAVPLTQPSRPTASCTAHHGRLVPDPDGRDLLALAYYGNGVVLVDFTDARSPQMVDQWNPGTTTWEAWYYNGYVFTGDLSRGLDVLTFE